MKGFLKKVKGLFKKKRHEGYDEEDFEDELSEDSDEHSDIDFDNLPPALRKQLESSGALDDSDDSEDDEDEAPPFVAQEMRPDHSIDQDATDPSIPLGVGNPIDSTQEMKRPDELSEQEHQKRLDAIRENSYQEDDFTEHSGINYFEEFQIPKTKASARGVGAFITKIKAQLKDLSARGKKSPSSTAFKAKNGSKGPRNFDSFLNDIFATAQRPKVHAVFLMVLTIVGTYSLGKLMALYLNQGPNVPVVRWSPPSTPQDQGRLTRELPAVARVDLFNANRKVETERPPQDDRPRVDETLICIAADQPTRLPIRLLNTTVLHDSVKSIAAVQVRGGRDIVNIREGQKIDNIAEVGRIDRMKLVVKNLSTGQCELVQTEDQQRSRGRPSPINVVSEQEGREIMRRQQQPGIQNEGNNFRIEKGLRDQMLENISEVLTQARAVQIQNPDGSMYFKMTEVVPGSIYSQLNIQDGDIIEGINGNPINNLNEVMSMFGRIREIDNLSLTIRRNGVSQSFDYSFD